MNITILVSGSIKSNFSYRPLAFGRSLRKLGHTVSIIAPKADKYNDFVPEDIHSIDGVSIIQPFQFTTRRLEINLLPYLFGAFMALRKQPSDIVYIYKPTPISIVGLLAKFFWKIPVIVDLDDLGSEVMKIEGHPVYQQKLVEWSEKLAVRNADRLVVASAFLYDHYRHQFPDKPIHIMPNGVDEVWFTESIVRSEKKRIVFLGALNRRSILEPLFDALPNVLKHIPEATVLIIGDGKYLSYFKEKSRTLNIEHAITFAGWLNITNARSRLYAGDIGYNYMPNERTVKAASNMKVPQYMSREVVPLVSDIGDLPATVDFGNAGYIANENNISSLEQTIIHALNDPDRIAKGAAARDFAKEKFDWDKLASQFNSWIMPHSKNQRPKIFVVATSIPGDVGGGQIRNYNLIKQLAKQVNADVDVFCIAPAGKSVTDHPVIPNVNFHVVSRPAPSALGTTRAFINRVTPFMDDFKYSGLGNIFRKACEAAMPDFVQIEQLDGYYCIREYIPWLKRNGVEIIFDCHNVEFEVFEDSLELFSHPKRLAGEYLVSNLRKMEIQAARDANVVLACSSQDAAFFNKHNAHTYIIPNGVDCDSYEIAPRKHDFPTILFMGGVGYPAKWRCHGILFK
jgi:glycosyltransferase involved in cell wall biosynthesis